MCNSSNFDKVSCQHVNESHCFKAFLQKCNGVSIDKLDAIDIHSQHKPSSVDRTGLNIHL